MAQYQQAHGQPLSYVLLTTTDPEALQLAQLVKEQDQKAGIGVTIRPSTSRR